MGTRTVGRTVGTTVSGTVSGTAGRTATETVADAALDQALLRIGELTERLWAVRAAHAPEPARGLRRRPRCRCCHEAFPCPTTRVATGAR